MWIESKCITPVSILMIQIFRLSRENNDRPFLIVYTRWNDYIL